MTLFTCFNCGIQALPECIDHATNLRYLLLQNNNITRLPDSFCSMKSLRSLDIANNHVEHILDCIGNVTSLTLMNLWGNNITHITEGICSLKSLSVLRLRENNIKTLPSCFGQLKSLTTLALGNNPSLATLPDTMNNLTNLAELNISFCNFSSLPHALRGMPKLRNLFANNNTFQALPDWIGEIRTLQVLSFDNNFLRTLPDTIGNLINLTSLYILQNEILVLPDSLTKATGLNVLSVGNNLLTHLPESLGNLTNLMYLYLADNRLSYLPSSTKNINTIQSLVVTRNCLDPDKYWVNVSSPKAVYDGGQRSDCGGCKTERYEECADCAADGETCIACHTGYKLSAGRCVPCSGSEFCPFGGTSPLPCGECSLCNTFASEPGHCFTCKKGKKSSAIDNTDCMLDCEGNEFCPDNRTATSEPSKCGACKVCDNDSIQPIGTEQPLCLRCPEGFFGLFCTDPCNKPLWCPDGGTTGNPQPCGKCVVCANDPNDSTKCKLCPEGEGYNSDICEPCENTVDNETGLCTTTTYSGKTVRIVLIVALVVGCLIIVFVLICGAYTLCSSQKLERLNSSSEQTSTSESSSVRALNSSDKGSSSSSSSKFNEMSTLISTTSSTCPPSNT